MRVVKLIAAMIAALIIGAMAVASASAAEVLWRWLPGAAKTAFTEKTGKATWQVKGGLSITSPETSTTGEITEGQNLGLSLTEVFKATALGLPINSLGDANGIILIHYELHQCLLGSGRRAWLHLILPLHLEVPSTKLLLTLEGEWIGSLVGNTGKTFTLNVEQKEGIQAIEKCEGGSAATLKTSVDGGTMTQTGFEAKEDSLTFTSAEQEAMES